MFDSISHAFSRINGTFGGEHARPASDVVIQHAPISAGLLLPDFQLSTWAADVVKLMLNDGDSADPVHEAPTEPAQEAPELVQEAPGDLAYDAPWKPVLEAIRQRPALRSLRLESQGKSSTARQPSTARQLFERAVFTGTDKGVSKSQWTRDKSNKLARTVERYRDRVARGLDAQEAQTRCIDRLNQLTLGRCRHAVIDRVIAFCKPRIDAGSHQAQKSYELASKVLFSRNKPDMATYYQHLGVIADAFAPVQSALASLADEPPSAAKDSWMIRLLNNNRGDWPENKQAPDTPHGTYQLQHDKGTAGGMGFVDGLVSNDGDRLLRKRVTNPKRECLLSNAVKSQQEILKKMKGEWNPNIAKVYRIHRRDETDHLSLIMEEVSTKRYDGSDVLTWASNAYSFGVLKPMEFYGAMAFFAERMLSVSDYLTCAGKAHSDIKPGNVVFHDIGEPVLVDFDFMCSLGETARGGHVSYMAPERRPGLFRKRVNFGKATPKAEVFAVGATLLKGMQDHLESTQQSLHFQGKEKAVLEPCGKDTFSTLLKSMMAAKPSQRSSALGAAMHPAVADRLLTDSEARAVIRKVMEMGPRLDTLMSIGWRYEDMRARLTQVVEQPHSGHLREHLLHYRALCDALREELVDGSEAQAVRLRGDRPWPIEVEIAKALEDCLRSIDATLADIERTRKARAPVQHR